MAHSSSLRTIGPALCFGSIVLLAATVQVLSGFPIAAEIGPLENTEIGFMALLAALTGWVGFTADRSDVFRRIMAVAAGCFALSALNDLYGYARAITWLVPFDDISALFSWSGAILLACAFLGSTGSPVAARRMFGTGLALQLVAFAIKVSIIALPIVVATRSGSLDALAEIGEMLSFSTYAAGLTLMALTLDAPARAEVDAESSSSVQGESGAWPPYLRLRAVDACDLCGSTALREIVAKTERSCRTVICTECGVIFASPAIDPASLDRFFFEGFEGDPGALRRLNRDHSLVRKAAKEDRAIPEWSVPLINRHMDLRGKRVLDIRSRTGSLVQALMNRGAEVTGYDPLAPNVTFAHTRNGLNNIHFMPITELAELRGIPDGSFDAVTALTVHTLSHLPSPRKFLERIHDVLRPGGLAFIDEKHALEPVKTAKHALFGAKPVHSFHFTLETVARYLQATGFEVIDCVIDEQRMSAFRHIRIVARKPVSSLPPEKTAAQVDVEALIEDVAAAQRRLDAVRAVNAARRGAKRFTREVLHRLTSG